MRKFHIHYSYTEKPGTQFPPTKYVQNTCGRVTFQTKIQVNDLHLYLNSTPHRHPPHTPLVKTNQLVSQQVECRNGLKCVNVTFT